MTCTWPKGQCECAAAQANKPDPWGRVWMHCEEGLSYTKASMARFMMFCLGNNIEIGQVHAFNAKYPGCQVTASVRLKPDQFAAFEEQVRAKLRKPPKISLN